MLDENWYDDGGDFGQDAIETDHEVISESPVENYEDAPIDNTMYEQMDESIYDLPPEAQQQVQSEGMFQKKIGMVSDLTELAQSATSGDADVMLNAIEKFSKGQMVRFFDITVIGPIMLYYAYKGKLSPIERMILGLIGGGTVIYNFRNFWRNRQNLTGSQVADIKDHLYEKI